MNVPPPTTTPKTNGKGSVSGFAIALVSLAASGIGSLLINAKVTPDPNASKATDALQSGTANFATSLVGVPFLVLGIALALLVFLIMVIRFRAMGADKPLFSLTSVLLGIWSLFIALSAFGLI